MKHLNLDLRKEVLRYSLAMELIVSNSMALLLGTELAEDTLCFGNKSTALSFNQKINLLIDMAALDKEVKAKFLTFMEVRNQFMHNATANSYENCFANLDGKDAFVLKHYPQDPFLSREDQLRKGFEALAEEVSDLTISLFERVKETLVNRATNAVELVLLRKKKETPE